MWFTTLTGYVAPFFIIMSPILSYSDQAVSMHRNKSSAGFSLDIPLIMLVASILKYAPSRPPFSMHIADLCPYAGSFTGPRRTLTTRS
jgi:hypothetical protein